jgi:1-acyl-sn-glycerol-3-phosphate acyltransferase
MMGEFSPEVPLVNRWLYWLARFLFRTFGWRVEGKLPDIAKYVIITTHTSNWDLIVGLTGWSILSNGFSVVKPSWMGKREAFRGPLGPFMKWLGGVPVDRGARQNTVEQIIHIFGNREKLVVGIAPEGTRKKAKGWKTGFYHIAQGAHVPIVLGFIDYQRKVAGIGPIITPCGDIQADMKMIRDFYSNVQAKHPDQVGHIVTRQSRHMERSHD